MIFDSYLSRVHSLYVSFVCSLVAFHLVLFAHVLSSLIFALDTYLGFLRMDNCCAFK